ncbi:type II secretion system F family protein [Robiginitomaculum antarcticum]|uniref:type II secretion system F family protein n=1 Tax=Robiginitomaculum antarcticum TaxID=437507 RepID=UPI00036E7896|nr:type II secretion system F family protein [Robiginitomaculum antarcticum]
MNPESAAMFANILAGGIALLIVATLYTVISPMLAGDKQKKRMKAVTSERDTLKRARLEDLKTNTKLRADNKGLVNKIVAGLSLERLLAAPDLRDKLMQGGFRGQRPVQMFYFFRMSLPIIFFLLAFTYAILINPKDWPMTKGAFITMGMTLFGYYLPGIYLKNAAKKRQDKIMPAFPDALDLLLICVESGMSVELAFNRVASEMAGTSIELAEEFSLTTAELSYLQQRRQAYENLARRNNHPGIRAVATALVQSERYGTPLGSTLRTMANENRELRVLLAEKKAAALPAKLTVPMIIFFLPVLFIVILTPAAMRLGSAFG